MSGCCANACACVCAHAVYPRVGEAALTDGVGVSGASAAGPTDLRLVLPGTIMQTGNYHFNPSSSGGAVVDRRGATDDPQGRKTAKCGEKTG